MADSNSSTPSDPKWIELATCPICYTVMQSPVFQCSNGHLVCGECRKRITTCHTGREVLGHICCLVIEQMVQTLGIPCSNLGCRAILLSENRREHEWICPFRLIKCPFPEDHCFWEGKVDYLRSHLMESHPQVSIFVNRNTLVFGINIQANFPATLSAILICYDHQFLIKIKKQHQFRFSYSFQTELISSSDTISKFNFTIIFQKGEQELRWTTSNHEQETFPFSVHTLELLESTIKPFCDDNNFEFTFFITKLN
ncbi:probable E3 ubiquitin-protein ligase sinah [Centruroides vittatus]|uniref:probable E3 ubiquitin-protein ligase sinah n=1 Tax=Centruroides vittatus TaxID=120091 RepID=UPI00351099DA